MKRIILLLILCLLLPFRMKTHEMESDTIYCDGTQVIIELPVGITNRMEKYYYTEGFFNDYVILIGKRPALLAFHYGALQVNTVFTDNKMNLYSCKLGNVARSRAFTKDSLFFRQDSYFKYSINISYEQVPQEGRELLDSILDNVIIRKIQ